MMQATAHILFCAVDFIGAAKVQALVFCISAHVDNRWTSINVNHVEYQARPSQACGGAGEPGEEQGAHEQQGYVRLLIPPARDKGEHRPCKHKLWSEFCQ